MHINLAVIEEIPNNDATKIFSIIRHKNNFLIQEFLCFVIDANNLIKRNVTEDYD